MIERLKECFTGDFSKWLLKSNNPKVGSIFKFLIQNNFVEDRHKDMLVQIENESLGEILDILLREPLSDYFWYTYKENGGGLGNRLTYSIPSPEIQAVPGDGLRVDKEKMKVFLRDIKIEKILQ